MLVEQHPDGYPAHIETIQEVLNVLADNRVRAVRLLVLHHSLSHGGNHIVVPVSDVYNRICETESRHERSVNVINNKGWVKIRQCFNLLMCDFLIFCISVSELQDLLETLHVPACRNKPSIYSYAGVKRSCKDKEKKRNMHTSSEPSEQTVLSASCRATGWSLSWCWPTSRATPVWGRRRKFSHMHFLNLRIRKSNLKCDNTLVFVFVENNYAGISYSCAIMSCLTCPTDASIHWFHNSYDWKFKTRHIQHGDLKM